MTFSKKLQRRLAASQFDWVLFWAVVALSVIGIFFIYSSGIDSHGKQIHQEGIPEYIKQIIWVVTGLTLLLTVTLIDYNRIQLFSIWPFLGTLSLLIFVLLMGRKVGGSKSWLGFKFLAIQPSEFAKITTIVILASFFDRQGALVKSAKNLILGFFIICIPMSLTILQSDFGTASVFLSIFFFMILFVGVSPSFLLFTILFGSLLCFYILAPLWNRHIADGTFWIANLLSDPKLLQQVIIFFMILTIIASVGYIFYKREICALILKILVVNLIALFTSSFLRKLFKPYQVKRLLTFLNPNIDPLGAGWQINQSITAIGSGGVSGKGFLQGTQSHLQYLPEQSTDFIFSIILEEVGFFGGFVVLGLYFVILWRIVKILSHVRDQFCKYLCAGALGLFGFHFMINIGMVLGLLPITGIPLLFLSYGGSSIWASMLMIGLVMTANMRHY